MRLWNADNNNLFHSIHRTMELTFPNNGINLGNYVALRKLYCTSLFCGEE